MKGAWGGEASLDLNCLFLCDFCLLFGRLVVYCFVIWLFFVWLFVVLVFVWLFVACLFVCLVVLFVCFFV